MSRSNPGRGEREKANPRRLCARCRHHGRSEEVAAYTEEHKRDCPYLSCHCGPCQAIGLRRKLRAEANRDKRQRALRLLSTSHTADREADRPPSSIPLPSVSSVLRQQQVSTPVCLPTAATPTAVNQVLKKEPPAIAPVPEVPASPSYRFVVPVVGGGPSLQVAPRPTVASAVRVWYPYSTEAVRTPADVMALSSLPVPTTPYWKEMVQIRPMNTGLGRLPAPPVIPFPGQFPPTCNYTCTPPQPVIAMPTPCHESALKPLQSDEVAKGTPSDQTRNSTRKSGSDIFMNSEFDAASASCSNHEPSPWHGPRPESPPSLARGSSSPASAPTTKWRDQTSDGEEPTARDLLKMIDAFPLVRPHALFDILKESNGNIDRAVYAATRLLSRGPGILEPSRLQLNADK